MPIPKIKINGTWTPIVTIPTTLSSFTNDVGYIVSSEVDNIFVQSSAPSSANNGDLWVDTTNSELKVKQSGGWTSLGGGLTATSPIDLTSGVISLSSGYGDTKNPYGTKTVNYVLAGPSSGSAAAPSFRALVADDIPSLTASKISDISLSNGTITIGNNSITPLTSAPVTSVNGQTGAVVIDDTGTFTVPVTVTWDDQTEEYIATTTVDVEDIIAAAKNGLQVIAVVTESDNPDNISVLPLTVYSEYEEDGETYLGVTFKLSGVYPISGVWDGSIQMVEIFKNAGVQTIEYVNRYDSFLVDAGIGTSNSASISQVKYISLYYPNLGTITDSEWFVVRFCHANTNTNPRINIGGNTYSNITFYESDGTLSSTKTFDAGIHVLKKNANEASLTFYKNCQSYRAFMATNATQVGHRLRLTRGSTNYDFNGSSDVDVAIVGSNTTANLTVSDTEPSNPSVGDVWIDTSNSGIPMANGVDF